MGAFGGYEVVVVVALAGRQHTDRELDCGLALVWAPRRGDADRIRCSDGPLRPNVRACLCLLAAYKLDDVAVGNDNVVVL